MTPDKHVRTAVFTAINNMVVNTLTIPCYDVTATNYTGKQYVIMSTQNRDDDLTKCGDGWNYTLLLDLVTRLKKGEGSRVLVDDIEAEVITRVEALKGTTIGGPLVVNNITKQSEPDLTNVGQKEIVHRKFLRYTFSVR